MVSINRASHRLGQVRVEQEACSVGSAMEAVISDEVRWRQQILTAPWSDCEPDSALAVSEPEG